MEVGQEQVSLGKHVFVIDVLSDFYRDVVMVLCLIRVSDQFLGGCEFQEHICSDSLVLGSVLKSLQCIQSAVEV